MCTRPKQGWFGCCQLAVSRSRPTCSRDRRSRKNSLVAANLQSAVPGPLAPETAGAQGSRKDGLVAANLQSAVPGPLAPETAIAQGPSKDGLVAANLQSAVPGPLALETTSAQGPSKSLRHWATMKTQQRCHAANSGRKAQACLHLRDGILGYHMDRPAKLDVAEAEAFKRLGWAQAVMKPEGAVDDAASETHVPAPAVAPEAAKAPSREPDAASDGDYTWKAAYNFVHRLKQNSKRLSECSEQLRLLLASNDESDKKKLIRLVTESKGKVEDLEMKVSHEQSVTEFETAKTRVTPVTEAELCQIYGSRAREVMDYKVSMGEFQEDQNLPGSRVFLIARDLAETGTDHKKSSFDSRMALLHCVSVDV